MVERILVVDDEVEICLLLTSMMRKMGFETDYANDLKSAERKFESNPFDIVFLDLNLPDGLGFQIIGKLKKAKNDTKVIIISAYDGNIEKQRTLAEGADFFVAKPFSKQKILNALDKIKIEYPNI